MLRELEVITPRMPIVDIQEAQVNGIGSEVAERRAGIPYLPQYAPPPISDRQRIEKHVSSALAKGLLPFKYRVNTLLFVPIFSARFLAYLL